MFISMNILVHDEVGVVDAYAQIEGEPESVVRAYFMQDREIDLDDGTWTIEVFNQEVGEVV